MCSCCRLRLETGRPWHYHGTQGVTASQSRPADILTTAAVPGRSAALDVCVASSIAAAARGDAAQAAFDRKLAHYRNEIGETAATGYPLPPASVDRGRAAASSLHSNPVETGSTCRRNPRIAGGNAKSKSLSYAEGQPWFAQFSRILQRGQSGSSQASSTEPCTTGDMSPPLTVGLATTTSTTLRLTQ